MLHVLSHPGITIEGGPLSPVRPLTAVCSACAGENIWVWVSALRHSRQLHHRQPLMKKLTRVASVYQLIMVCASFFFFLNLELRNEIRHQLCLHNKCSRWKNLVWNINPKSNWSRSCSEKFHSIWQFPQLLELNTPPIWRVKPMPLQIILMYTCNRE